MNHDDPLDVAIQAFYVEWTNKRVNFLDGIKALIQAEAERRSNAKQQG